MQNELKCPRQRRFDGRAIDLAVSLAGMAIASDKLRSYLKDRQEQGGTLGQVLQVQIAAIDAGRSGIDFAGTTGRRHRHYPHERLQRNLDVLAEQRDISLKVELDYFLIGFRQKIRNDPAPPAATVSAVRNRRLAVTI